MENDILAAVAMGRIFYGIILKNYWFITLASLIFISCGKNPTILWTSATNGPIYGSPAISDGFIFVGSQDKHLYAINIQDGSVLWKKNLGSKIVSTPIIYSGSLYIGSGNGEYFSLDPKSGKTNWSLKTAGLIHYESCADESGLYFGNDSGQFLKVNHKGKVIWTYQASNKFGGHCQLYKDLVLTSSWDTNFYGLNKSDGSVIWKVSSRTLNYGGPEIVGNNVYFATHQEIYCLDASTGKTQRVIRTPYLVHVTYKNNHIWTNEKGLTKRNLNGEILGSIEFDSETGFKPLATNGIFILGGTSNTLYGVSEDLKILWKLKQSEAFWAPGLIQNNVYFTGNRNNNVYAIQLPKS